MTTITAPQNLNLDNQNRIRLDSDVVKAAAVRRWPDILRSLTPELAPAMHAAPGRHVTCPLPDHDDHHPSFRMLTLDEGRAICTCGAYDPWNLLERLRGWTFAECLRQVADYLGMSGTHSTSARRTSSPSTQPSPRPEPDRPQTATRSTTPEWFMRWYTIPNGPGDIVGRLAARKQVTRESLMAYGAVPAGADTVKFPMWDHTGHRCSIFTIWPDSDDNRRTKGLNASGQPTGMFFPLVADGTAPRLPAAGETWVISEGVKDAAKLAELGYLAVGLPGKTLKTEWAAMFMGVNVIVLLDNDPAGREAAATVARRLA